MAAMVDVNKEVPTVRAIADTHTNNIFRVIAATLLFSNKNPRRDRQLKADFFLLL